VKSVVLEKAKTLERQKLFIRGHLMGPGYMGSEPTTPATSVTASSLPTTMTSPVSAAVDSDGVSELTKRIERLTLLVEGRPQRPATDNVPVSTSVPVAMGRRCLWCDSMKHVRRDCVEFTEALRSNLVRFNDAGRVVLVSTGQELLLMIGKDGMKRLVELIVGSAKTRPLAAASGVETTAKGSSGAVRVITVDDQSFGSLGGGSSARVTTLDFEKGIRTDEIIDAEANEKRKRMDLDRTRRVRSRIESTGESSVLPSDTTELGSFPAVQPTTNPIAGQGNTDTSSSGGGAQTDRPKFRLVSELNQSISSSDVGKKVMDAPIQLSIREILAVSNDVSNYIHDQTRKRRVPLETDSSASVTAVTINGTDGTTDVVSANVHSAITTPLYACPSGRTKVYLDDEVPVSALLDDGSELNIMSQNTFDQLQHPLDSDINWKINGYDSKAKDELEELEGQGSLLGVCHDVLVDVSGVAAKQHIFVVSYLSLDLILGQPWGRSTRAQFTNEDDGSYTVKIKSLDGRRSIKFVAVRTDHERNREHVRPAEERVLGVDLKA
jgi:hypothetical protein